MATHKLSDKYIRSEFPCDIFQTAIVAFYFYQESDGDSFDTDNQ